MEKSNLSMHHIILKHIHKNINQRVVTLCVYGVIIGYEGERLLIKGRIFG